MNKDGFVSDDHKKVYNHSTNSYSTKSHNDIDRPIIITEILHSKVLTVTAFSP